MGQTNTNPASTTEMMQKVIDLELPIAVWYSMDVDYPGTGWDVYALQNNLDGTLRSTGFAFRSFINNL
jgi:hypothetical protein